MLRLQMDQQLGRTQIVADVVPRMDLPCRRYQIVTRLLVAQLRTDQRPHPVLVAGAEVVEKMMQTDHPLLAAD
jgi:hypothetical protein